MQLTIASGKGGTGKTTVAVNLALAAGNKQRVHFVDADVEEPNAHLFLKPALNYTKQVGIPVPQVNQELCTGCGKCAQICEFNAIAAAGKTVITFPELCHGCGGCTYFCPEGAITEISREIGTLEAGQAENIDFMHGRLNPGEALSPPLIKALKDKINTSSTAIIDAPPGTSCPVVEAVSGCDFCLLVTEPTPFGLNDLGLSVQMLRKLDIPCGVVINRSDMGDKGVESYCQQEGIPVLAKIPWNRELARLYGRGETVVPHSRAWKTTFSELWEKVLEAQIPKQPEKKGSKNI